MGKRSNFPPFYDAALVKSKVQRYAAFDFETENLGGKVLLGSWAYMDGADIISGTLSGSQTEIITSLIEIMKTQSDCIWWAHNAQYDWRYIMQWIKETKTEHKISMRTKTDIYQITMLFDGLQVRMNDSLAIWQGKLADLLRLYAPNLPKLDIDDIASFNPENPAHRAYAERDAAGLCQAMYNLDLMIQQNYNVSLRPTAASTAMAAWEKQITRRYYMNETQETFIRKAYYGGLVFLTSNDVNYNLETYDINSSYPFQMKTYEVPYGNIFQTETYQPDKYGIYDVTISSNACEFPCLPTRSETGGILWPLGTFRTTITNIEIEFAISKGYTIQHLHSGVIFEEKLNPFAPFVTKCEAIRYSFKGKPEEQLAKLMQNSLYGKFGSRRERVSMFVPETDEETIGAEPWDEDQFWWIKTEEQDLRCMPAWAVFITARARLHLIKTVFDAGVDNVIYGDTDSLTLRSGCAKSLSIGNAYGDYKLEKQWEAFVAIAPKVYVGILGCNYNDRKGKHIKGEYYGAAKGMIEKNMSEQEWRAIFNDRKLVIPHLALPSLKVTMRRGITPATMTHRSLTDIANSKGWRDIGNGQIRPRILRSG